ncbi:MAG: hypothetical protein M3Q15_04965, partial [Pseudomonadota bacterium]|nr:hypothetical protein [Pseudomonadota bacterium]
MKDDRFRIRVDSDYASALGLAVYAFASLEWNAVQCCERIDPGHLEALSDRTAGRVADTLRTLVRAMPVSEGHAALDRAARDFQAFARTRNNLLHAKPGVDASGARRLFRDGDQWTLSEIETVADAFAECGARLHDWL